MPELDELTITIVVDNATDTLSSIAPGIPQLPEMAYLLGGVPPSGQHDGHDCVVGLRPPLRRLSRLLGTRHRTTRRPHRDGAVRRRPLRRRLAGQRRTAGRRPVQHRRAVPVALALGPLRRHHHRRRRHRRRPRRAPVVPPLVVDVHPDRPDQRGILTPFDVFAMLPPEPTIEAIEAAGGRVVTHADVHDVADLFLASGDIPRQTELRDRPGRTPQLARRPGHPRHGDPRRALPRRQRPRPGNDGAHRLLARRRRQRRPRSTAAPARTNPVDLLLGGYHLAGTTVEDRIEPTVRDLTDLVAPGSSHPDTAPAGAPPPHSRTHSARPATRRASSAPATCSAPCERPVGERLRGWREFAAPTVADDRGDPIATAAPCHRCTGHPASHLRSAVAAAEGGRYLAGYAHDHGRSG